jgi:hypothetical protein
VKLFSTSGIAALTLALMPQLAWAAAPKGTDKQAGHPAENTCVVIDDGSALACAGGDPEVADKAKAWMEERAANLRAKPDPSAEDAALLQDYEAYLSGPDKIVTIKPMPH